MSTPSAIAEELKMLLRGLLISSPSAITVDQLERDFLQQEGQEVPFRKLGYPSFLKYLESIPDTVILQSSKGGCPVVVPVLSEKTVHIKKMVQKQKYHPPKQGSGIKLPAHRRYSVNATPQMSTAHYSTNYNSYDKHQSLFLPASLQQRIYKMIHDNPKGVPVQTIEQEFFSGKVLQNCGIHEDYDIHYVLSHLGHILRISDGMVYPLHNETPPYRPVAQNQVTGNKISNIYNSQTYSFIPAGSEGTTEASDQRCTVNVINEFSAERNKNDIADIRSLTFDTAEASPDSGSPSDGTDTYICDFASDLVSKKMRMNFQTLLDKDPNGIPCSKLPDLYEKEFGVVLEYADLGFVSVMQMVSSLPDVFHCVRVDGTDWKLFNAQKELPPEYARYNMKNNSHVSTKMVPTVPRKIALNIGRLLRVYPCGIPSEQIPHLYTEEFLTTLNVHELGFCSLEAFLLVLEQSNVLHVRYVKSKILVYPAAQETEVEPEEASPFPHITEPQAHLLNLYPPEVVDSKGTLAHEKIPPEATPGEFIEVLVADIITPLNFWIQLRGEKTQALDTLMNDMQQFYLQEAGNYNMPGATIRIGQYCVAPYDKEWHRACITAVHNLLEVQVIFVDYGTTCRIPKSELRFMHTDFAQFPIQAIKASLANLVPVGGGIKWPREACVCFLELVKEKDLVAIVSTVDHEARKLEVALVNTAGEEDIHINDVLVSEGHAEYKTKRRALQLPPQPKRIDGDPLSSTVTVSRPPPGFTAVSELHKQPLISPTVSAAAPRQSTYIPTMPGCSHPQTLLPNVPMVNTIVSNVIPQSANMLIPPVIYDIPLIANTSSLAAKSSMLQNLWLYENLLHQERLKAFYTFLVNPFIVPELSPPVVYIPTPGSERITNVGQSELGISDIPSCTLPSQKNASGQISPSGTGQLAAAAHVSAEDPPSAPAAFDVHTETTASAPATDLSEYIYRSDDEDDDEGGEELCEQQEQPTLQKSSVVKQIEIAGRVIHLIKLMSTVYFCTEEVVRYFTDFSGRHVVLKILDARKVKIPFYEIERKHACAIFADLETYDIVGVPKSPEGYMIGKVHLTPLNSFTHFIPLLNEEDRQEFCRVMESVVW